MNPTQRQTSRFSSDFGKRVANCTAVAALLIGAASASAQVSSINSVLIQPRVFNDVPSATGTYNNAYPGSISFAEANVNSTSGFADRDVWYFSNNGGASAYQFGGGDYFSASMTVTLSGGLTGFDLEAGWLFSNPSGNFGGDLQSLVTKAGVVVQFGGPSYYPFSPAAGGYPGAGGSVPNYVNGQTYTLGLTYTYDFHTGMNAFEYSVNGQQAASSPGDPYFDLGPGQYVGSSGDELGGYFQIQTANPTNGVQSGQAVFGDISITALDVPEPCTLALIGVGALFPLAGALRRRRD